MSNHDAEHDDARDEVHDEVPAAEGEPGTGGSIWGARNPGGGVGGSGERPTRRGTDEIGTMAGDTGTRTGTTVEGVRGEGQGDEPAEPGHRVTGNLDEEDPPMGPMAPTPPPE